MTAICDFLDQYQVPWSKNNKHSRPNWTQVQLCPNCHSDRYHLGIKDDLSRAACYKCGGKHVPSLIRELTKAPWSEIKTLLGERAYTPKETKEQNHRYMPPTVLQRIDEVPAVAAYLRSRRFNIEYLESIWKIQATGPFSDYPLRAFIPIFDRNRPVSWTARAACGQEPRYQTAAPHQKLVDEKQLLFGEQFIKDSAIVVEGPLSAIFVGRGTVATLGLSYTTEQVNRLSRIRRRIICFDNEPAAQIRARILADNLSVFPGETFVVNLDAEDPQTASATEIKQLREFAFERRI